MLSRRFFTVSTEILKAIRHGDPVVALESTIISHGMPYPKNIEMAAKVEKIIREKVSAFALKHSSHWIKLILISELTT